VYRQAEGEEQPRLVATANGRDWTDATAEFGKKYSYLIQTAATAGDGEAESEISAAKSITYEDKFPPAPVAGFAAIPGVNSVELAWDRATEADLKGYLVYRALEGGAFERLGELQTSPSCRDTTAVAGKKYRYRVTAVDVAGNESAPSEAVEIIAP
jgi:fibronectin type 3 domain-containing protein